jgi:hypothetical protein
LSVQGEVPAAGSKSFGSTQRLEYQSNVFCGSNKVVSFYGQRKKERISKVRGVFLHFEQLASWIVTDKARGVNHNASYK